jgi:hypothetical protein
MPRPNLAILLFAGRPAPMSLQISKLQPPNLDILAPSGDGTPRVDAAVRRNPLHTRCTPNADKPSACVQRRDEQRR